MSLKMYLFFTLKTLDKININYILNTALTKLCLFAATFKFIKNLVIWEVKKHTKQLNKC